MQIIFYFRAAVNNADRSAPDVVVELFVVKSGVLLDTTGNVAVEVDLDKADVAAADAFFTNDFVAPNAADEVEEIIFAACDDGYRKTINEAATPSRANVPKMLAATPPGEIEL